MNSTEYLVMEYQSGKVEVFDEIVHNMDRLVKKIAFKGVPGMEFDEVYSELLEVLWKCCQDYNGPGKLSTVFYIYAHNKIRELRERMMRQLRRANIYALSLEQLQDSIGFEIQVSDIGFADVETKDLIQRLDLTNNQRICLQLLLSERYSSKTSIANEMGVDASSINYFQRCIANKLTVRAV